MEKKIYTTSFCNFGHYVENGRPVKHECYVLPPGAIKAEMKGDYDEANRIMSEWDRRGRRTMVKGR